MSSNLRASSLVAARSAARRSGAACLRSSASASARSRWRALYQYLAGEVDAQLRETAHRSAMMFGEPLPIPPPTPWRDRPPAPRPGPGPEFLDAPGQPIGLVAGVVVDGVAIDAGVLTVRRRSGRAVGEREEAAGRNRHPAPRGHPRSRRPGSLPPGRRAQPADRRHLGDRLEHAQRRRDAAAGRADLRGRHRGGADHRHHVRASDHPPGTEPAEPGGRHRGRGRRTCPWTAARSCCRSGCPNQMPTRTPRSADSAWPSTGCSTTSRPRCRRGRPARAGSASSSPTPATNCAPRWRRFAGIPNWHNANAIRFPTTSHMR